MMFARMDDGSTVEIRLVDDESGEKTTITRVGYLLSHSPGRMSADEGLRYFASQWWIPTVDGGAVPVKRVVEFKEKAL